MQRHQQEDILEVGQKMVTVRVGREGDQQDFVVYESLLCKSSEFFEKAIKSPWRESEAGTIRLPAHMSISFTIYYQWLLTGRLHTKLPQREWAPRRDLAAPEFLDLCMSLRLGHDLADMTYIDTISDGILAWATEEYKGDALPPLLVVACMYDTIPDSSPTKQLLMDVTVPWLTAADKRELRSCLDEYGIETSPDFYLAVLESQIEGYRSRSAPALIFQPLQDSCKYHSHGEEKPCYREKAKVINSADKKRPASDSGDSPASKRRG